MIKEAVMLMAFVGGASAGLQDLYQQVRGTADSYVAVYAAAGEIDPYSGSYYDQIGTMYAQAEKLQGVQDSLTR